MLIIIVKFYSKVFLHINFALSQSMQFSVSKFLLSIVIYGILLLARLSTTVCAQKSKKIKAYICILVIQQNIFTISDCYCYSGTSVPRWAHENSFLQVGNPSEEAQHSITSQRGQGVHAEELQTWSGPSHLVQEQMFGVLGSISARWTDVFVGHSNLFPVGRQKFGLQPRE